MTLTLVNPEHDSLYVVQTPKPSARILKDRAAPAPARQAHGTMTDAANCAMQAGHRSVLTPRNVSTAKSDSSLLLETQCAEIAWPGSTITICHQRRLVHCARPVNSDLMIAQSAAMDLALQVGLVLLVRALLKVVYSALSARLIMTAAQTPHANCALLASLVQLADR